MVYADATDAMEGVVVVDLTPQFMAMLMRKVRSSLGVIALFPDKLKPHWLVWLLIKMFDYVYTTRIQTHKIHWIKIHFNRSLDHLDLRLDQDHFFLSS